MVCKVVASATSETPFSWVPSIDTGGIPVTGPNFCLSSVDLFYINLIIRSGREPRREGGKAFWRKQIVNFVLSKLWEMGFIHYNASYLSNRNTDMHTQRGEKD